MDLMKQRLLAGILVALIYVPDLQAAEPDLTRLRDHVTRLASPEFLGRRDRGAELARDYLIAEFRKLNLTPLFGDSFRQEVTGAEPGAILGVNLGAKLEPTDPKFADEWIILGAHYDHLGQVGQTVYPGADDNASGVAMMLEVARSLIDHPEIKRRGIMFVGFDLEERGPKGEFGLRGSQFFAGHPPVPLDQVRLFVTADMIGRSLGGVCLDDVFVLGSENEPGVRPWINQAAEGKAVRVNLLGADVLVIDRSDYGPFRTRQIPYLFFTTGENPVYHSPRDIAATLNYEKLTEISRIIAEVIRSASQAESVPMWATTPDYPVAEAEGFRNVFRTLLDHRDDLKLGIYQVALIKRAIQTADTVITRGSMLPEERNVLARTAQVVLFTVF